MEPIRQGELETCLLKNIKNKLIDHIYILVEKKEWAYIYDLKTTFFIHKRPDFNDFFSIINKINFGTKNEINIIANADIFFDASLQFLINYAQNNIVLALTRYNFINEFNFNLHKTRDSQDSWIFFGKINQKLNMPYLLGTPGCDNKLAFLLDQIGYKVINPSLTIKTYHLHSSPLRFFDESKRILPPHKYLEPTI